MTRDQMTFAPSARLEARLEEIENGAEETFDREAYRIDCELDARWYARHDDARVRQAMGW